MTSVPETTFNNMHGKITDLDTVDASILAETKPNALGELICSVFVCVLLTIKQMGLGRRSKFEQRAVCRVLCNTVVTLIICFRLGKAELLRAVEREGRVGERRLGAAPRPALLAEIRARRGNLVNYQGT